MGVPCTSANAEASGKFNNKFGEEADSCNKKNEPASILTLHPETTRTSKLIGCATSYSPLTNRLTILTN